VWSAPSPPAVKRRAGTVALEMESCKHTVAFNIQSTAGLYSTLTGVLAGFAFTALVVLVTFRLQDPGKTVKRFAHAAQALVAAFLSLTLMSLLYAALGGEPLATQTGTSHQGASGRSSSAELVLGLGFVACGLLLIYALIQTLQAADSGSDAPTDGVEKSQANEKPLTTIATHLRTFTTIVVLPLFGLFVVLGAQDYQQARYGDSTLTGWTTILGVSLVAVLFLAGCWLSQHRPTWPDTEDRERVFVTWFSYALLGGVVVTAITYAVLIAVLGVCDTLPPAIVICVFVISTAGGLASAYVFAHQPFDGIDGAG